MSRWRTILSWVMEPERIERLEELAKIGPDERWENPQGLALISGPHPEFRGIALDVQTGLRHGTMAGCRWSTWERLNVSGNIAAVTENTLPLIKQDFASL